MSSYVEAHVKKKSSLNFMSLVGFQASKICMFFLENLLQSKFWIVFKLKQFPKATLFWILW